MVMAFGVNRVLMAFDGALDMTGLSSTPVAVVRGGCNVRAKI